MISATKNISKLFIAALLGVLCYFSSTSELQAKNQVTELPFTGLMQSIKSESFIPDNMVEPFCVTVNGPVICQLKVCKWNSLQTELLTVKLIRQFQYIEFLTPDDLWYLKAAYLLFPFHYFW